MSFRKEPKLDQYAIKGEFVLSGISNGIDPVAENVIVRVGTSTLTIPAGSFKSEDGREAEFEGRVNGVSVKASIEARGQGTFKYKVKAWGVDLTNSTIPINVSLQIGADDSGSTAVPLHGELELGQQKDRGDDSDHDGHDDGGREGRR